jgi:adenosyl cobinamide kinase/adenosyl cobinamide phosphate guanylyltransferase
MGREVPDEDVVARARRAASAAADRPGRGVAVTNEVGAGVVPEYPLGRRYRDLLGVVNATWGDVADRVGLAVAGRLLPLGSAEAVWSEDPGWLT